MTTQFPLPDTASFHRLRIDPCDEHRAEDCGYVRLQQVRVMTGSTDEVLWSWDAQSSDASVVKSHDLVDVEDTEYQVISGDDPHWVIEPGELLSTSQSPLVVEVDWKFGMSREYGRIQHRFLAREAALASKVDALQARLARAEAAEQGLARIQASTTWRLITAVKRLLRR